MSKNRNVNKKIDPNLKLLEISPLTDRQQDVFNIQGHAVLHGAAGTGKTLLSSYLGYKSVLNREFSSLVYIRSAVPSRNLGFMPGNEAEKLQVYEQPYREIAIELFDRGDAYDSLKHSEIVKFTSTSYIRGINLNNVFIVVDECQNMTFQELDTIMTRIGRDSRVFFCGDYYQKDIKDTGIVKFYNILKAMHEFEFIDFTIDDVVRSNLVKSYLKHKYDQGNFEQSNLSKSRNGISEFLTRRTDVQDSQSDESGDADNHTKLFDTKAWRYESTYWPYGFDS